MSSRILSCSLPPAQVERVLDRLEEMDAKDLPPVVYQLLLLSGKHGLQRLVLEGLADYFEGKCSPSGDAESDEEEEEAESNQIEISNNRSSKHSNNGKSNESGDMQRAQGTVLMHVATAMRHSRELS